MTTIWGGRVMVTAKLQLVRWVPASLAEQVTTVTPGPNGVPEAGVHVVWTGAVPPVVVGAGHETVTGWFWSDSPDCPDGQVIVSVAGGGGGGGSGTGTGVGVTGGLPHLAASADRLSTSISARDVCPHLIQVILQRPAARGLRLAATFYCYSSCQ